MLLVWEAWEERSRGANLISEPQAGHNQAALLDA